MLLYGHPLTKLLGNVTITTPRTVAPTAGNADADSLEAEVVTRVRESGGPREHQRPTHTIATHESSAPAGSAQRQHLLALVDDVRRDQYQQVPLLL